MLGDLGLDLDVEEVEGRFGGVGWSFSDWVVSSGRIWDLVFKFGQGSLYLGPWIP